MEVTSLNELVAQAPKKEPSALEKFKGLFKKKPERVEPTPEAMQKAAGVESRLLKSGEYAAFKAEAEADEQKGKDFDEARKKTEESRDRLRELAKQDKLLDAARSDIIRGKKTNYQAPDYDIRTATQNEVNNFQGLSADAEQKQKSVEGSRGDMVLVPLSEDLTMYDSVMASEKKAVALEMDMIKGMEAVSGMDSRNMGRKSVEALQQMSMEVRGMAISVVAELDEQRWGLDRVIDRRETRFPDANTDVMRQRAEDYIEGKKQDMSLEAPKAPEAIDANKAASEALAELKNMGVLDETTRGMAMIDMGFERGADGKWAVNPEGLYARQRVAAEQYRQSVDTAKELMEEAKTNPDKAVAAYLAINRAVIAGSAGVTARNEMRGAMIEAAKEQMRLNVEARKIADEKKKEFEEKMKKAEQPGFRERAAARVGGLFGKLREAITAAENAVNNYGSGLKGERGTEKSQAETDAAKMQEQIDALNRQIAELNKRIPKQP